MTEFQSNAIVAGVAALLAFLFAIVLDVLRSILLNRGNRRRTRQVAQKSLQSTLQILQSIKSTYNDKNFFDYIYIGQLDQVSAQLSNLRFTDQFFKRSIDQSSYFDTVSKLLLLNANIKSIQNYEYSKADDKDSAFIDRKKHEYMLDLSEMIQKMEGLINILDD